ncbi:hypothetical protein [Faecalicatena contorta]|uniref:hypothetical protein n=1 Tax=Faecalicatena contorta TaxID=39482 RepID=UPI0031D90585
MRSEASACNVPRHQKVDGIREVEDKYDARESKSKKKSMKSVSLISDTCGCGETHGRIHVILTPCGKKNQYVL